MTQATAENLSSRLRGTGDDLVPLCPNCMYCGHKKESHDVAAPASDNWRICYECTNNYSHVFRTAER